MGKVEIKPTKANAESNEKVPVNNYFTVEVGCWFTEHGKLLQKQATTNVTKHKRIKELLTPTVYF